MMLNSPLCGRSKKRAGLLCSYLLQPKIAVSPQNEQQWLKHDLNIAERPDAFFVAMSPGAG
jgi:hypothetical protein